jgi:hypothetical protein
MVDRMVWVIKADGTKAGRIGVAGGKFTYEVADKAVAAIAARVSKAGGFIFAGAGVPGPGEEPDGPEPDGVDVIKPTAKNLYLFGDMLPAGYEVLTSPEEV